MGLITSRRRAFLNSTVCTSTKRKGGVNFAFDIHVCGAKLTIEYDTREYLRVRKQCLALVTEFLGLE